MSIMRRYTASMLLLVSALFFTACGSNDTGKVDTNQTEEAKHKQAENNESDKLKDKLPTSLSKISFGDLKDTKVNIYELGSSGKKLIATKEITLNETENIGYFDAGIDDLDSNKYYLYVVEKDEDENGQIESKSISDKLLRAVVKGSDIKDAKREFNISYISEILYQKVKNDLDNSALLKESLENSAKAIIQNDIDGNGVINAKDILVLDIEQNHDQIDSRYYAVVEEIKSGADIRFEDIVVAPKLKSESFTILQNLQKDSIVGKVTIVDDGNAEITEFRLHNEQELFTIDGDGYIRIKSSYNYALDGYRLKVSAKNSAKVSDIVEIPIHVLEVDVTPPVFKSPHELSVVEGDTLSLDIVTEDSSSVTYTLFGEDKEKFLFYPSTHRLTFNKLYDFENPEDNNKDNIYKVTIKATDIAGNSTKQDIKITVLNKAEEVPVLEDALFEIYQNESNRVIGKVVVKSSGDTPITEYVISENELFDIDSSANIALKKGKTFKNGEYRVYVWAKNKAGQSQKATIDIDVKSIIEFTSDKGNGEYIEVKENHIHVAEINAKSLIDENEEINVSILYNEKDGYLFNYGSYYHYLQFDKYKDYENPVDGNRDNIYEVKLKAEDSKGNYVVKLFKIKIKNIKEAKIIDTYGTKPDKPYGHLTFFDDGKKAYSSQERFFKILDMSNPQKINVLGELPQIKSYNMAVSESKNIVYAIGTGNSKVYIIDVKDSKTPKLIHTLYNQDARYLFLSKDKNILYVCQNYRGITLYDVSNPLEPKVIKSNIPKKYNGMYFSIVSATMSVDAKTLAISCHVGKSYKESKNMIIILDLSVPTNPAILTEYEVDTNSNNIHLSEDKSKLFFPEYNHIRIYDISNPSDIKLSGTITPDIFGQGFTGIGDFVYNDKTGVLYAMENGYLFALDISNPENPTVLDSLRYDKNAYRSLDIYQHSNKLYLSSLYGFKEIDISNSNKMIVSLDDESVDVIYSPTKTALSPDENFLYVGGSSSFNGVDILDVSDKKNIKKVSHILSGTVYEIKTSKDGNILYVAGREGLTFVDVSDPYNPKVINDLFAGSERYTPAIYGFTVSNDDKKLYIDGKAYDISNLEDIQEIYSFRIGTNGGKNIALSSDEKYLYIPNQKGLKVYDIQDVSNITLVNDFSVSDKENFRNGYIKLSNDEKMAFLYNLEHLYVLDISDLSNIKKLYSSSMSVHDMEISKFGQKLYLSRYHYNYGTVFEVIEFNAEPFSWKVDKTYYYIKGRFMTLSDDERYNYSSNYSLAGISIVDLETIE